MHQTWTDVLRNASDMDRCFRKCIRHGQLSYEMHQTSTRMLCVFFSANLPISALQWLVSSVASWRTMAKACMLCTYAVIELGAGVRESFDVLVLVLQVREGDVTAREKSSESIEQERGFLTRNRHPPVSLWKVTLLEVTQCSHCREKKRRDYLIRHDYVRK